MGADAPVILEMVIVVPRILVEVLRWARWLTSWLRWWWLAGFCSGLPTG